MDTSTVPRPAIDDDTFIGLVIDRRRHVAVPLRWPGLAEHNVVALFPTLRSASLAASRLAARPASVSAVVLLPVDPALLAGVAVGVHTARRDVAEEATVSFRRSGAMRVARFATPVAEGPPPSTTPPATTPPTERDHERADRADARPAGRPG